MKITRLTLARYGHLSDVELVFDPDIPLHIVLGANEAGKSTALSAIADALFGFPHRSAFAFLHAKDLRVGIGLLAADGRTGFFTRRKGRPDKLQDAQEAPVAESAMTAFLAGAGRDRFVEIFGMDGAELRKGGAAMLEEKGEIGQSLIQATTGLPAVREAVGKLNEDALKLYGDRRGDRAFHLAAQAFRTAKQDMEDRSVRPAEYEQAFNDRKACFAARARNAEEAASLERQRAILDRIRRTTPARLALLRDRTARAALGDVPPLPADAGERRSKALQSREILGREQDRALHAQAEDEAALDMLAIDDALLADSSTIDALAADLNRIEEATRDRIVQRRQADQARGRVEECGRRLGLVETAETLVARMPDDLVRAAAERAIKDHTELLARHQLVSAELERTRTEADAAQRALADLPPPEDPKTLVASIEAAKAEGRIDTDLAQEEESFARSSEATALALAALPFWQGTAEALAASPMPLAAPLAQAADALSAAERDLAEKRRALKANEHALQLLAADISGVLAAGIPPTAGAIAAARDRRDRAWRLIRRHRIEGGPAPTQEELDGLPQHLPDALTEAIAEADALADRRAGEAERVATYDQLRANQARSTAVRDDAATALTQAETELARSMAAWTDLWRGAGIAPADPATMREWATRRDAVLAAYRDAQARQATLDRIRERRDSAWQHLAVAIPNAVEEARGQVGHLLRSAERLRTQREEDQCAYTEARRALSHKQRAVTDLAQKRATLGQALADWAMAWRPVAQGLGLPADADSHGAAVSLSVWTGLDAHRRDWRAAEERILDMTASIEAFDAQLAACIARCAADLADMAPGDATRAVVARLAAGRLASATRTDMRARIKDRAVALATTKSLLDQAEDDLSSLRALAGVADDLALREAISRSATHGDLSRNIAEREHDLRALDDGLTMEDLTAEAEGVDPENLPTQIAAIDERRNALAQQNEDLASRLRDLETRLLQMEKGEDAAEAAQRMQNAAADAQEIAARYVRLRLSHALLRGAIDRVRREQQAPLLSAAGELFALLTDGRYARLATDEEDDKVVVVALRPDGTHCPADRLSEGTRDQLYLALRLAAIRTHAAHTEPLPFIADDLLASFDDARAKAALKMLAQFGSTTQTILFTHHAHIAALADLATTKVHSLPERIAAG